MNEKATQKKPTKKPSLPAGMRVLITLASFVVVVAGMKQASTILVPFFLALLISIICAPPMYWLQRKGFPKGLAVALIIVIILSAGFMLGAFVTASVNSFMRELPEIQRSLGKQTSEILVWLQGKGVEVNDDVVKGYLDAGFIMRYAADVLSGFTGLLTNAFLILLTVVFILLEASSFPNKLAAALDDPEKSISGLNTFLMSVNRYLAIKTLFSLITGILIFTWLTVIGVNYPLMWGILAFLLNFVPNIGSIIAAVPPVLLALIQQDQKMALFTAIGYIIVNVAIGSITEPRFMGKGLGLSTLVVFLSLVFWGWVLGPVGMLLSVLLTMILKIALESNEDTRWMAIMLGPEPFIHVDRKPRTPLDYLIGGIVAIIGGILVVVGVSILRVSGPMDFFNICIWFGIGLLLLLGGIARIFKT